MATADTQSKPFLAGCLSFLLAFVASLLVNAIYFFFSYFYAGFAAAGGIDAVPSIKSGFLWLNLAAVAVFAIVTMIARVKRARPGFRAAWTFITIGLVVGGICTYLGADLILSFLNSLGG